MRTADTTTNTTRAATIMIGTKRFRSISPPPSYQQRVLRQKLPRIYDRRRTLDLHDIHHRPHRDHLVLIERTRRPHLTGELDQSLRTGNLLENHRLLPDQRVATLPNQRSTGHLPSCDRPHHQKPHPTRDRKGEDLRQQGAADTG